MQTPWYVLAALSLATPWVAEAELPAKDSAEFQTQLREANARTIQMFPEAGQKGTALYEWVADDVALKKKSAPHFFDNPNWPWNITCEAVREFKATSKANGIAARLETVDATIIELYRKAFSQGLNATENAALAAAQNEGNSLQSSAMDKSITAGLRSKDVDGFFDRIERANKSFLDNMRVLEVQANRLAQEPVSNGVAGEQAFEDARADRLARAQNAERNSEQIRDQQELNQRLHNLQRQLNDLKSQLGQ